MPRASVILPTYNQPHYLKLVLCSLATQTEKDFEVVIGDDGSTDETKVMLDQLRDQLPFDLKYHWQEDDGYRLGEARNGAVRLSSSDWLIFVDGDMVVHPRFIEAHLRVSGENRLLFGGRVKLTEEFSKTITEDTIRDQGIASMYRKNYFKAREKQYAPVHESLADKLSDPLIQWFGGTYMPPMTPMTNAFYALLPRSTARSLCFKSGSNFSTSRDLVYKVNGFDKRFGGLSGEDGEFFWRVHNAGGRPRSVLFTAIGYHLWHKENWQRIGEQRAQAMAYQQETIDQVKTRCVDGLMGPDASPDASPAAAT